MQPWPVPCPPLATARMTATARAATAATTAERIQRSRALSEREAPTDCACPGGRISTGASLGGGRSLARLGPRLLLPALPRLGELALEDLAGRVARQLLDERHLAGDLVVGEVLLDVGLGLLLV